MKAVARVFSDFSSKFGIPRQSGLVPELKARVVFEPEFRNPEAVRGLEQFSHIWLIWQFSESPEGAWSPTVRPPRLGGNKRVGVFASRSPFRPNPLGLSCVVLERIEQNHDLGPVLHIAGADMMDGTPVLDIKPYVPYADSHPEASEGFTEITRRYRLEVEIPGQWLEIIPEDKRRALAGVLAGDPRPSYQHDPGRIYGLKFAGLEVKFTVDDGRATVCAVCPAESAGTERHRAEDGNAFAGRDEMKRREETGKREDE